MFVDLRLEQFRSYNNASFEFSPGVNIIVGPNASGKTNLLEAILVLAKGRSYRAKDSELIQFNKDWARLDTRLISGSIRVVKLKATPLPGKSYEIDGKEYKRPTLNHVLPVVLFEPNHLRLLSGGPELRREYLDDLLEQTVVGYSELRRKYQRALTQRNAFLKQSNSLSLSKIFPWNIKLSELAGQIVRERDRLAKDLNQTVGKLYKKLSKTNTDVQLNYKSQWLVGAYESSLLKELESNLETDRARGFTAAGPHREDLLVLFNNRLAQETASRGEIRTAVLALKISELELIKKTREITPALLLDDVFSELDGKRRHALTEFLSAYQAFITTTDADIVQKHFTNNANVVLVTSGKE